MIFSNSPVYALAIHTASPDLGLAISNFAEDWRHQTWSGLGQDLSTQLHRHLAEFIQPQTWADLAFVAITKGPGGFTGTRLGIVTARTLAQQLNIPLFAISTLAAVAWKESSRTFSADSANVQDIAIQMPAQRGALYTAIYSIEPAAQFVSPVISAGENQPIAATLTTGLSDSVMNPQQWQQILENWHRPYRLITVEGGLGETTLSVLELAYLHWQQGLRPNWSEALPFYGQSPV